MTSGATKLSVSLPTELLRRAEKNLARPGETRSALLARVLKDALSAAEDAQIDAEIEQAYAEYPISTDERRVLDAFTEASLRGIGKPRANV